MNGIDKDKLIKAFGIPEPEETESFFERPEFAEEKKRRRGIAIFHQIPAALRYGAIVMAAAAVVGVWGGFRNWANTDKLHKNEAGSDSVEATSSAVTEENKGGAIVTTINDGEVIIVTTSAAPEVATQTTAAADKTGNDKPAATTTAQSGDKPKTTTAKDGDKPKTTTAKSGDKPKTTTAKSGDKPKTTTTKASGKPPTTTAKPAATTTKAGNSPSPVTTKPETDAQKPAGTTPAGAVALRDRTVDRSGYNVSGRIVDVREIDKNSSGNDGPTAPTTGEPGDSATGGVREMIRRSDAIALVRVEELIYFSNGGFPFTQENVEVISCYTSGAAPGELISIVSDGGYIPANEYAGIDRRTANELGGAFIYDPMGNNKKVNKGDVYICFLEKESDGSYRPLTGGDSSKYEIRNGYCYNINTGSMDFTEEELYRLAEEYGA